MRNRHLNLVGDDFLQTSDSEVKHFFLTCNSHYFKPQNLKNILAYNKIMILYCNIVFNKF